MINHSASYDTWFLNQNVFKNTTRKKITTCHFIRCVPGEVEQFLILSISFAWTWNPSTVLFSQPAAPDCHRKNTSSDPWYSIVMCFECFLWKIDCISLSPNFWISRSLNQWDGILKQLVIQLASGKKVQINQSIQKWPSVTSKKQYGGQFQVITAKMRFLIV